MQVEVRRGQGTDTDVTVFFKTRDLAERVNTKPGVDTYQALAGEDYTVPTTKSVRFAKGEVSILCILGNYHNIAKKQSIEYLILGDLCHRRN